MPGILHAASLKFVDAVITYLSKVIVNGPILHRPTKPKIDSSLVAALKRLNIDVDDTEIEPTSVALGNAIIYMADRSKIKSINDYKMTPLERFQHGLFGIDVPQEQLRTARLLVDWDRWRVEAALSADKQFKPRDSSPQNLQLFKRLPIRYSLDGNPVAPQSDDEIRWLHQDIVDELVDRLKDLREDRVPVDNLGARLKEKLAELDKLGPRRKEKLAEQKTPFSRSLFSTFKELSYDASTGLLTVKASLGDAEVVIANLNVHRFVSRLTTYLAGGGGIGYVLAPENEETAAEKEETAKAAAKKCNADPPPPNRVECGTGVLLDGESEVKYSVVLDYAMNG